MTDIDWSKAPEGTTGAMVAQFHHPKGYGAIEFLPAAGERARYSEHAQAWVYVPRPARWEPGALPPVGTVCEYNDLISSSWTRVKILAHFDNQVPVAVFIPDNDSRNKEVDQAIAECFRPVRTAEQIAAEEKQNAWLAGIAAEYDQETADKCAAVLVAGGYRKAQP